MSENYFFRPLLDSQGEPLCLTGKRGSSVYNNMIEFRNYMDNSNNFKKERITIDVDSDSWNIDQCKQKAHLNNSNFFIVGDFSHNSIAKDASYNCFLAQPDIITHNNYKNVLIITKISAISIADINKPTVFKLLFSFVINGILLIFFL